MTVVIWNAQRGVVRSVCHERLPCLAVVFFPLVLILIDVSLRKSSACHKVRGTGGTGTRSRHAKLIGILGDYRVIPEPALGLRRPFGRGSNGSSPAATR